MTASRRLAAILAADVAGYSRLMGEDEAGTAKIVRERREAATPIVRAFGGRLVKTTGDGVLLEFASVIAAVECAILVQKMMADRNAALPEAKGVLYRIGVNLGDVLIEGDDILGDGVNIAARLEGICEPGGVCVSGSAYEHVGGRIEAEFADLGEQRLKNILKPVRAYALPPDAIAAAEVEAPETARVSGSPPPDRREPPRLSLVVLPFANIGGDPEQEYFVDGVTESLITDLSRISGAFVIGRSTAFTYRGKAFDHKQIGRELNVRYLLEGSVQRGGGRMRVNVQLIEAGSGAHLWAERFDKPVADLFDMQDEIVSRLANRLGQELVIAEARRAERAPIPDSMDHYFLGLAAYNRSHTVAANVSSARAHFDRALEIDPANVDALIYRGSLDLGLALSWSTDDDRLSLLRSAEADVVKALRLRPDDPRTHGHFGAVCVVTNRIDRGVSECQRALAIDRNHVLAHYWIGVAKYVSGRNGETEAHVLEALRLSPRDRNAGVWIGAVGFAKLGAGRDEEAIG